MWPAKYVAYSQNHKKKERKKIPLGTMLLIGIQQILLFDSGNDTPSSLGKWHIIRCIFFLQGEAAYDNIS